MQAIPLLFSSLSATATTAATVSTLATGLSVAGAAFGAVSSISQAAYQSSVAKNNAALAERNAQEATLNSQKENQQRGLMAAVEMGELLSQQSASGLNLGSGSYSLARKSQAQLAAKDSQIVADGGAAEARNFLDDAATFRSEASQAKRAGLFGAIEGGINIGTSFVSGAAKTKRALNRKVS